MENQFKLKAGYHQSCYAIQERGPAIKISSLKRKTELYTIGQFIMRSSSPSQNPCIKQIHKRAKKRAIRRRRVDLNCGCSIFIHINCVNHGFTHRGAHHCSSSNEWRFYLGSAKSPLFQDTSSGGPNIHTQQGVSPSNQVQLQPSEEIRSSQSLFQFPNLDDFSDSFWDDIFK
nr:TrAP [Peristrophe mosaic virus]